MTNSNITQRANRLIKESSPYLLQHAHNPVDWFSWGEEALTKAKIEDRPIFVSIGYSACHWCHRLREESFENEETAALMNARFVCIKVDREERPDLDAIYMDAVQAMTGSGGWPMSVFLTPEGQPFYGGTYYPPAPRYGMPSFSQVLIAVSDAYANKRADIEGQAERLTAALARSGNIAPGGDELSPRILTEAVGKLEQYFDDQYGGFGSQPKFPQPMALDFAMSRYAHTGDAETLNIAETTLERMAEGGIYDQLGGGFHRYSVDRIWLVPHFEKMLYDSAQLLRSNLNLWKISGRELFRRVVNETTDYVLREMTSPEGGFYSSQDADSEGEEGKFFVWTPAEIEQILGKQDAALFGQVYGVTTRGNFEGHTILNIVRPVEQVAKSAGLTTGELEKRLGAMRQKLFVEREKRIKPGRDEKVLTEWNGLMIHALAEVGVALDRPDALAAAQNAANLVLEKMSQPDGKLYRTYKDGQAKLNAYLEDYAAFVRGLIALYESTFDLRWLAEATRLTHRLLEQFGDPDLGGLFQTGADHERLVVRRKDFIDNAIPSGNSLAAESLLRLAKLTGNDGYRQEAQRILWPMASAMAQQPTGFGRLLGALDDFLSPSQEIAIVGDPADPATQALLAVVRRRYLPHTVVALKRPGEENPLPLLEGRGLVNGKPAAYVCENFACKLPVTDVNALADLLDG